MQIDIIGVPIDLGADRRGVDMGPSAIRYAHLQQRLESLGYVVEDKGNIEVPIAEMCKISEPKLKYIDCIVPMARRTAGAVATSLQAGHFPLVLGGDHSVALGSIHGAAKHRKLGVLWVDAHADFNTPETTPSGNIHGMPLAALCGLGDPRLTALWDERAPALDPRRVAVIGARDLDPGEKRNLKETGVLVMSMEQIDRLGMVRAVEKAIERISRDVDGIFLSFDMDSLDPRHAPGVGTPVPGGLTYREAHLVCELVAETGKLLGLDLVEVNPILDVQNTTAALAVELAMSALGSRVWSG
ncbi:MAG: arginase [Anaerolineales bacterium]|nr:arginase [Anaerolineales bacterium]MCX7754923.1 arginase [Anaerolineales bacterium]MDW8278146.1 arginase [Anaerolineales bacterium]